MKEIRDMVSELPENPKLVSKGVKGCIEVACFLLFLGPQFPGEPPN